MAKSETKKQQLIVIGAAVLVVLSSVITTVIVSGKLAGGDADTGYKNTTFTDAVQTCRNELRRTYKKEIESLVVDDHSSRYDTSSVMYKIFLDMDLKAKGKGQSSVNYVNCFVRASNGKIDELEVLEEVEVKESAVPDNSTNAFGWPR